MTKPSKITDHAAITSETYADCSDSKLLTLIGMQQDRMALNELYNRYRQSLARFLHRQLGDDKLIEECYNDVMLVVWQKAGNFRGESKVSTWIFSIAYRTQIANARKENRHRHVDSDEVMDSVISQKQAEQDNQTRNNETLYAALSELSDEHRSVIELSYFHGYSVNEISKIVACPANTVKTRLFHARKKLKAAIEADQASLANNVVNDDNSIEQRANNYHSKLTNERQPSDRIH